MSISVVQNTHAEILKLKYMFQFRQYSVRINGVRNVNIFLLVLYTCWCSHLSLFFFFFCVCAGKKKISLYDSQAPICPICQVLLRPGELQEHMETEIERLANICLRYAWWYTHISTVLRTVYSRNYSSFLKGINSVEDPDVQDLNTFCRSSLLKALFLSHFPR